MTSTMTVYANVDGRTISWSKLDHLAADDGTDDHVVSGGVLTGDQALIDIVKAVLDTSEPNPVTSVRVDHPSVVYEFTEGRDTPADVVAALVYAGAGRAILSDSAWEIIEAALGDDDTDEFEPEDGEEIIY